MFNRWFGKKNTGQIPMYSDLRQRPTRPLPAALLEREQHPDERTQREEIQQQISEQLQRSDPDQPILSELLSAEGGVVTIPLPEKGVHCLPVFSSPYRAADYVQTLMAAGPRIQYPASSAAQFLRMLRDLERAGINSVAVDRCPRCEVFVSVRTNSIREVKDVHSVLAIAVAMNLHRANLYFEYALEQARKGLPAEAREVALETAGHTTFEDPRPHLLLGLPAIKQKDRKLLQEAKAFLAFLNSRQELESLTQMEKNGVEDFNIF